jgi:hypothetical protein
MRGAAQLKAIVAVVPHLWLSQVTSVFTIHSDWS